MSSINRRDCRISLPTFRFNASGWELAAPASTSSSSSSSLTSLRLVPDSLVPTAEREGVLPCVAVFGVVFAAARAAAADDDAGVALALSPPLPIASTPFPGVALRVGTTRFCSMSSSLSRSASEALASSSSSSASPPGSCVAPEVRRSLLNGLPAPRLAAVCAPPLVFRRPRDAAATAVARVSTCCDADSSSLSAMIATIGDEDANVNSCYSGSDPHYYKKEADRQ